MEDWKVRLLVEQKQQWEEEHPEGEEGERKKSPDAHKKKNHKKLKVYEKRR